MRQSIYKLGLVQSVSVPETFEEAVDRFIEP